MKTPLVTVIIPTYNACNMLLSAIESVLRQSWEHLELIIVNDGSTDNTEAVVQDYLKNGKRFDPRVKYVKIEDNFGKSHALNKGIELSRGNYVAFLDQDDTYHPDCLKIGVDFLEHNPDSVAVYGDACKVDLAGDPFGIRKSRRVKNVVEIAGFFRNPIASSSMIIRQCIFEKIGKLDTFFYRIDDVCRNILLFKQGTITYIPLVLMNYRIYRRRDILKYRIRTLFEFYILIRRYYKGFTRISLYIKQSLFQLIKFSCELFTFKK